MGVGQALTPAPTRVCAGVAGPRRREDAQETHAQRSWAAQGCQGLGAAARPLPTSCGWLPPGCSDPAGSRVAVGRTQPGHPGARRRPAQGRVLRQLGAVGTLGPVGRGQRGRSGQSKGESGRSRGRRGVPSGIGTPGGPRAGQADGRAAGVRGWPLTALGDRVCGSRGASWARSGRGSGSGPHPPGPRRPWDLDRCLRLQIPASRSLRLPGNDAHQPHFRRRHRDVTLWRREGRG